MLYFLLTSLILSLPLISARPTFTSTAYLVPILKTSTSTNSTSLAFTIYDPDPVTNITSTCGASWPTTNGSYPSSWINCKDKTFRWYLSKFADISNFTLEVQHSFIDPSLGPPPEDVATTFARGTFSTANLTCTDSDCGLQAGNGTVKLHIWAAVG